MNRPSPLQRHAAHLSYPSTVASPTLLGIENAACETIRHAGRLALRALHPGQPIAISRVIDALTQWLVDLEGVRPDRPISAEPFIESAGILHQAVQTGIAAHQTSRHDLHLLNTILRGLFPPQAHIQLIETYAQWETAFEALIIIAV
ncbi:MAG: hypothetical protein ACRDHN_04765 [Thermomicrobiales bacterium]